MYIPDGFETGDIENKCRYWLKTGDLTPFTNEELEKIRVFVQVDQSGAEALIVAYLCKPGDYRQLFLNNVKPHVYVALKLFKDVWTKKMKDKGGLVEDFNIDLIDRTPIPELKQNPFWHDLDLLIKDSDNWKLTERYYYFAKQTCHCVDGETEVLTKKGWVRIDSVNPQDEIAIVNKWQNVVFEVPQTYNQFQYTGDMYHFQGDEVDQLVTPNHKMIYKANKKWYIKEASDFYHNYRGRFNIPTSAFFNGSIILPEWKIQLLAAVQADANIQTKSQARFRLVKDRKIERLTDILIKGKVEHTFNPYTDLTSSDNMVSEFVVKGIDDIIELLGDPKRFGAFLLTLSKENIATLVAELPHWDGTYTESYLHKRVEYMSKYLENVEWIKTILHLHNRQGTILKCGEIYKLGLNNREVSIASNNKIIKDWTGMVYCPAVSTGMFMIRRNGKISITHNSANYGIRGPTFQMNVLDKSGGKVALSKEDAERFLTVYRSLFPEIVEWNRQVLRQVEENGILYNLHGFPYYITDYLDSKRLAMNEKEWISWVPQSTVGEITRIAFSDLQLDYIEPRKKKWDILADTHDSFMCQCPLYEVLECISTMQQYMNQEFTSPFDGVKFRMKSEANIGFNWAPEKPKKNELGLQSPKWLLAA